MNLLLAGHSTCLRYRHIRKIRFLQQANRSCRLINQEEIAFLAASVSRAGLSQVDVVDIQSVQARRTLLRKLIWVPYVDVHTQFGLNIELLILLRLRALSRTLGLALLPSLGLLTFFTLRDSTFDHVHQLRLVDLLVRSRPLS